MEAEPGGAVGLGLARRRFDALRPTPLGTGAGAAQQQQQQQQQQPLSPPPATASSTTAAGAGGTGTGTGTLARRPTDLLLGASAATPSTSSLFAFGRDEEPRSPLSAGAARLVSHVKRSVSRRLNKNGASLSRESSVSADLDASHHAHANAHAHAHTHAHTHAHAHASNEPLSAGPSSVSRTSNLSVSFSPYVGVGVGFAAASASAPTSPLSAASAGTGPRHPVRDPLRRRLSSSSVAVALLHVLETDKSCAVFRAYLASIHADENLRVWDAINEWATLSHAPERAAVARRIVEGFILPTAENQINLKADTLQSIMAVYGANDEAKMAAPDFFDAVQVEVFSDLKQSPSWKKFQEEHMVSVYAPLSSSAASTSGSVSPRPGPGPRGSKLTSLPVSPAKLNE